MTDHVFKVGDKGKTRCGYDYEVTAVGRHNLIVDVCGNEKLFEINGYWLSERSKSGLDLIPPKRRIQGWVNVLKSEDGYSIDGEIFKKKEHLPRNYGGEVVVACFYIDIEEGEGM